MSSKLIAPILIAALIAWMIFVRVRRSFGCQRVQPRRTTVRIATLALFGVLLVLLTRGSVRTLAALLAGGGCGAALGYLGLRHTRFESNPEGRFYTPHSYIGLTVTVLFLARIVSDYLTLYHGALSAPAGQGPLALPPESPLTLAISAAFIAYYLTYYIGILRRSRQPAATAREPSQPKLR